MAITLNVINGLQNARTHFLSLHFRNFCLRSFCLQYEGDDENIDVDGVEEMEQVDIV